MSSLRAAAQASTTTEPVVHPATGIDYSHLFNDPNPATSGAQDPAADPYGSDLVELLEQDPESYRMVIFGWA